MIIWFPKYFNDSAGPLIAVLSDSVPPLVKIISFSEQFNISAKIFLEFSIESRDCLAGLYGLEGFANECFYSSEITFNTSSLICVDAELSK